MTTVSVLWPAAWCFVPLRTSTLVAKPDPPKWPNDGGFDWLLIAGTVADAVRAAQRNLSDPVTPEVNVTLDLAALSAEELYKVGEWLALELPEFDPAVPDVTNGRNRTWYSREAGAVEAPVLNSTAADALRHWHDKNEEYGRVDDETFGFWLDYRKWWDSDDAATWVTRNRTHLLLWDRAIDAWRERLHGDRSPARN